MPGQAPTAPRESWPVEKKQLEDGEEEEEEEVVAGYTTPAAFRDVPPTTAESGIFASGGEEYAGFVAQGTVSDARPEALPSYSQVIKT